MIPEEEKIVPEDNAIINYQNQVGPNVQGVGFISINTNGKSAKVFYSPAEETKSKVLYSTNYHKPDTPLPIRQWLTIPGAINVYIDYAVEPGGDIKICWSII